MLCGSAGDVMDFIEVIESNTYDKVRIVTDDVARCDVTSKFEIG